MGKFMTTGSSPGLGPRAVSLWLRLYGSVPKGVSPGARGRTHLPRSHRCSRDCGSCGQPALSQVAWLADLWMTRGRWVWTSWSCCGRCRAVHRAGAEIQRLSTDEGESSTRCPRCFPSPGSCKGTLSIPIVFHTLGTTMGDKHVGNGQVMPAHTCGQRCGTSGAVGQRDWLRIRLVSSVTWL